MDPPYGIKFGSNWQVSTRKREVSDGKDVDVTRQPEQIKAFRDTWELGIHSYLAYLRDRLTVARELLTESGSCFVQIGDENVHLVRSILDEVFGAENFVAQITVQKTSGSTADVLPRMADFIIWYAKSRPDLNITGDGLDEAHLDHAYALTVHRAQGATYDRAHVLAAGGGRELAYVALSRARDHTAVYATADDLYQAIDDLQDDWGVDRHQRWIARHPDPRRTRAPHPDHRHDRRRQDR